MLKNVLIVVGGKKEKKNAYYNDWIYCFLWGGGIAADIFFSGKIFYRCLQTRIKFTN